MARTPSDDDARAQRARTQRLGQGLAQWERTTVGVRVTADALAALPARRWTVLHGPRWPEGLRASADHVVVGRGGVYVIDTKNWSGAVRVKNGMLLQAGQPRGVAGAIDAAAHVASLLDRRTAGFVHPVVCVARDEPVVGLVDDVFVCSTWNVRELLTSRPRVLSRRQARAAARELGVGLRPVRVGVHDLGHRSARAGSGGDSVAKDVLRAGAVLAAFVIVVGHPTVVTEPVAWLGERLVRLAE